MKHWNFKRNYKKPVEMCPKTQEPKDTEKCYECDYDAGHVRLCCLFGITDLEDIQAQRQRDREYDIAVDDKWREV